MTCGVIIPAFNNAAVIHKTLQTLFAQAIPVGWRCRVIISDDGSTDNTASLVQKIAMPANWQKKVIFGKHTGPGAARNRALDQENADVILFLGADIFLRPGALAQHLAFHEQHPEETNAVLGMVKWDPRLPPTPLMEWMNHGGQQNDFDSLLGVRLADPTHFFYASHLSLKRSLLGDVRFPENDGYGWEDLELGRQLQKKITLHILHQAIGLHHHLSTLSDIARRQRLVGENIPGGQVPRRSHLKYLRRRLFIALGGQWLLHYFLALFRTRSFPGLFLVFTSTEFWRGVWTSQSNFLPFLRGNSRFLL